MEDKSIKVTGTFIGTGVTGDVKGNITTHIDSAVINELPDSPDPSKPGIKELLIQLQEAIQAETSLPAEDKEEALEQLRILAEAGKNPKEEAMQKMAKRATTMLKGIICGLPTVTKLAEECNKLLPLITKVFGL